MREREKENRKREKKREMGKNQNKEDRLRPWREEKKKEKKYRLCCATNLLPEPFIRLLTWLVIPGALKQCTLPLVVHVQLPMPVGFAPNS
jgi:hypothetical protein